MTMTTKKQLEITKAALERIANPIKAMQEDADKEGARINGIFAVTVSENGAWYKEVAKTALNSLENG